MRHSIDFRLSNTPMPFAQEVYSRYSGKLNALHPEGFSSKNFIQLDYLPSAKEWESIFHMFPFKNLLEYSFYFAKISVHLSEKQKTELMIAYGIQANVAKERELLQLADLSSPLQSLFVNRNIPPRLLFPLKFFNYRVIERLAENLSGTYLKNNVVKEIVELFIDLTPSMQEAFLQEVNQAKKNASKDGFSFLNERFRNILYSLRFPTREKIKSEMYNLLKPARAQLKNIKINYDDTFERDYLSLEVSIRSNSEIYELSNITKNQDVVEALKQALTVLKDPDQTKNPRTYKPKDRPR